LIVFGLLFPDTLVHFAGRYALSCKSKTPWTRGGVVFTVVFTGFLAACGSLHGNTGGAESEIARGPLKRLAMGMSPEEAGRLLPDTACRNNTEFHGNPAQVWGFKVNDSDPVWIPKGASCDSANFWVYFEEGRLVGWTPVP